MDVSSPGNGEVGHSPSPTHINSYEGVVNSKGQLLTGTDCAVCEEPASNGSFFRRHYGVICCEACKCFFRRTVQMSRDYKCRFGGKCYVGRHADNLKQVCQACRFNKCIQSGMKIESVKKFPRKPRNPKGSPEDGKEAADVSPTKTPKKGTASAGKTKRQKKPKKDVASDLLPNGDLTDQHDEDAAGASGDLEGTGVEQDEDLALSDTDLVNVKFKMSPSEAMLYLQSASTSVSQLFKYDGVDGIQDKASLASPMSSSSGVENMRLDEGKDGHPYPRATAGRSPGVSTTSSSREGCDPASGTSWPSHSPSHGVNGCDRRAKDPSYRGKRGPEEAAKAAAREAMRGRGILSDDEEGVGGIDSTHSSKRIRVEGETPVQFNGSRNRHTHTSHQQQQAGSMSTPPLTPTNSSPAPPTMVSPGSRPSSRLTSPVPQHPPPLMMPPSNNDGSNNCVAYNSPYVTPQSTPVHTPYHSPLPSPHTPSLHQQHFHHASSMGPRPPSTHSPASLSNMAEGGSLGMSCAGGNGGQVTSPPAALSSFNLPGLNSGSSGVIQLHQQHNAHGTILLNAPHGAVPIRVLAPTAAILPATMLLSAHPTHSTHPTHIQGTHPHLSQMGMVNMPGRDGQTITTQSPLSGKSPFRIVPIPSINRTLPEEVPNEVDSEKLCDSPGIHGNPVPGSTTSSACPSPVHAKPKAFSHFAEAQLDEVLQSLGLRIRSLFAWAKSDVSGFDDLSPLDQKALLRRTVPELVMLGFAKGSVPYEDMLMLGSTGKVIRPTNQNNGVANVASVTLQKLVVPLKILNINDRELVLLKEIVLFNPESNGLRNREVVRLNRKQRHLKLLEYTEKSQSDPSRFGELMCLLTPLFEVSTEVTEQLRLEQFVHEGEARIDALLLMSMINVADEIPDGNTLDSQL